MKKNLIKKGLIVIYYLLIIFTFYISITCKPLKNSYYLNKTLNLVGPPYIMLPTNRKMKIIKVIEALLQFVWHSLPDGFAKENPDSICK